MDSTLVERPCHTWGGGGGGSHVRLNFKTSRPSVFITSLSESERKFFVFVGILEKEDSDALQRNHYSSAISRFKTFSLSNTCGLI